MRKTLFMIVAVLILAWVGAALAADPPKPGDLKEVALVQEKGVKGEAKGKLVINTANGTDLAIQATGLEPKGVYTVFFMGIPPFLGSSFLKIIFPYRISTSLPFSPGRLLLKKVYLLIIKQ